MLPILIRRNRKAIRPDIIAPYSGTPCGRLMIHSVLRELHANNRYEEIVEEGLRMINENHSSSSTIDLDAFNRAKEAFFSAHGESIKTEI